MATAVNYFAREKQLPRAMTIRLREFFAQTQHVHREQRYDLLLDNMSARLKADAALCWARGTLMKVSYFQGDNLEDNFLASTALCLQTRVFCRSEYLQVDDLQIIERGICAKHGRIFTKGACLGEDMVLADPIFRDLTPAVALTFVAQVSAMEKKHLEALLNEYPIARRKVRAATYRLAFCKAMVALAKVFSREEERRGVSVTMTEALQIIRQEKTKGATRLVEPTRHVLITTLSNVAARVEEIGNVQESLVDTLERTLLPAGPAAAAAAAGGGAAPPLLADAATPNHPCNAPAAAGETATGAQFESLRTEVRGLAAKLDSLLALHTPAASRAVGASQVVAALGSPGSDLQPSTCAQKLQRSRTGGRSGDGGERPPPRRKQRVARSAGAGAASGVDVTSGAHGPNADSHSNVGMHLKA